MVWRKKYKLTYIFLSAVILLFMPVHFSAQTQEDVWTQEEIESARDGVKYEGQSQSKKQEKKENPTTGEPEAAPLQKQISPFWQSVIDFFKSPGGKILTFIFILSLLVFTIFKFMKKDKKLLNSKVISLDEESLQEMEDNLVETDLEKYLRLALEEGNYKLAVRILYLSVLQKLHDSDYIKWKKDKTNNDYLREMRRHKGYHNLKELTLAFEIIWYGDTEIKESTYNEMLPAFNQFQQSISGSTKDR